MNLSSTLHAVARRQPDHPAVTSDAASLSYAQFEAQAASIAGALVQRHRIRPGDRVAMLMENCAEFFPALYGIWRGGAAAVPINARLHPKEAGWIIADSGAKAVFATPDLANALSRFADAACPPVVVTGTVEYRAMLAAEGNHRAPDAGADEAWLFYTSGTTGRPKGAVLTHRNLLFMCHAYYADIDFIGPDDTMLHAAPLSHGAGLYALAHVARGSHNVVLGGSFDPERVLAAFSRFRNVSMFAAPTMVMRLVNDPAAGADLGGLKTICYGGAPMYVADLKRALALFGPRLFQVYGQGESPMTITGLGKAAHAERDHPDYEHRLVSAGVARTGVEVRIAGEDGREVTCGEVGEVVTRSDCVMPGYWNNPEANAKALRGGWLWTGDLGSLDEAGFLTIKDRSKDMIISGGSNIYPREIEEVLFGHPGVLECAVVGRPHVEWGEEVIAYVVRRPGATVDTGELETLCLDNIARYKRPSGYHFVEGLPKNNYGKVLKTALRDRADP